MEGHRPHFEQAFAAITHFRLTAEYDHGHMVSVREGKEMEQMVSKSQFKPKSLEYFRRIEETGEALVITDRGRPVLKVIPYTDTADPEDRLKILRNSVIHYDDPTEPAATEEWQALK